MTQDKRAALVMQIMAEFMRHPARSSKAAEAALDIALKAAAEIAARFPSQASECQEIADAILAVTSEGTKP